MNESVKAETIMRIGILLMVVNIAVYILDYIVNSEFTMISGYFTLVGFAGLMTFMYGICRGCIGVMGSET